MDVSGLGTDLGDLARRDHVRLRWRLLSGGWREDAYQQMVQSLGLGRTLKIGEPDMSANPFEAWCSAASALFDQPPRPKQADAGSLTLMKGVTDAAQLYGLMPRFQRDTLGMRELLMRATARKVNGLPDVTYEPVRVDRVSMVQDPANPSRPVEIRELVDRPDPRDAARTIETLEVWSIRDQTRPFHQVLTADGKTDLSRFYGLPDGGARGLQYPALRFDGRAILPYVLYHAAITGQLLDSTYRAELIHGTLRVAALWTFAAHCVFRASWPQRWISGGRVVGGTASKNTGGQVVTADPALVVEILADGRGSGQVQAGQWAAASDPKAVAEAVCIYEDRFTSYVDIPGFDMTRQHADGKSGYGLSVDAANRRLAQRKYEPIFRPPDSELLSVTATLVNNTMGRQPLVVEDGWGIDYVAIPLTADERKAMIAEVKDLLAQGLISKAEGRARILGEDERDAADAIAALEAEAPVSGDAATLAGAQTAQLFAGAAAVARGESTARGAAAILKRAYGVDAAEAAEMLYGAEELARNRAQAPTSTPTP